MINNAVARRPAPPPRGCPLAFISTTPTRLSVGLHLYSTNKATRWPRLSVGLDQNTNKAARWPPSLHQRGYRCPRPVGLDLCNTNEAKHQRGCPLASISTTPVGIKVHFIKTMHRCWHNEKTIHANMCSHNKNYPHNMILIKLLSTFTARRRRNNGEVEGWGPSLNIPIDKGGRGGGGFPVWTSL